jgi:MFS family permease
VSDANAPSRDRLPSVVLSTCFLFALVSRGIGETFAVFLLPLQEAFGWDRAQVTGIYAVTALAVASVGPLAGYLSNYLGTRRLYAVGGCLLLMAYVGAVNATELWHFYVTLGFCVGAASAFVNVAQTPLIAIWFVGRVGTVFGIIGGAAGIGALLFAPMAQMIIDASGYRAAYGVLAAVILILVVPLALLPWRRIAGGRDGQGPEPAATGWTLWRAASEPILWAMFAVYFLTSTAIFVIQPQMVAYMIEVGFTPLTAATAIGFAGLAASLGMVLFGWIADRVGRRWALSLSYLSTALGLGVLALMSIWPSRWLLVAYVLTFGLSLGSRGPLIVSLTQRIYAGATLGKVIGFLLIGMGTGTAFGSWAGGELHDHFGGYQANFAVAWVSIALALAPWWLSRELRRL